MEAKKFMLIRVHKEFMEYFEALDLGVIIYQFTWS